jgi:sugar phosphate permease
MIAAGLLVSALVTLALSRVDLDTNLWVVRALMFTRGLGFGFVLVPLQAATYATISPSETGRATALYNAASQVASSLGVAVAASTLTRRLTDHGAILGAPQTRDAAILAFQDTLLFVALLMLVGVTVALLINDRDAAPTMTRAAPGVRATDPEPAIIQ